MDQIKLKEYLTEIVSDKEIAKIWLAGKWDEFEEAEPVSENAILNVYDILKNHFYFLQKPAISPGLDGSLSIFWEEQSNKYRYVLYIDFEKDGDVRYFYDTNGEYKEEDNGLNYKKDINFLMRDLEKITKLLFYVQI